MENGVDKKQHVPTISRMAGEKMASDKEIFSTPRAKDKIKRDIDKVNLNVEEMVIIKNALEAYSPPLGVVKEGPHLDLMKKVDALIRITSSKV